MPIIVSRAADRLRRRQGTGGGGGNVVAGVFVLSVLAIIIAIGIFLVIG